MRVQSIIGVMTTAIFATSAFAQQPGREHLNPMIELHAKGLPVFGITHPNIAARGGGAGAATGAAGATGATAAPAPPTLADIAKETLGYRLGDFQYNSYSARDAERFKGYMEAIIAQGGGMREHAFISKVPNVSSNPAAAQASIIEQLNAGHAGIFMQRVETAAEIRQAIAAMRFVSKGGIRPDTGIDLAAKYWGLTRAQYLERADVWPVNPNGELVVYAIVESNAGIANIRELAADPGVAAIIVGSGTLGGIIRDPAAFDAAITSVVAACKEFKKPCGYPANNPTEMEQLMARGFTVFTMQRRNQAGFDAIAAGRKIGGRPMTPR